MPLEEFPVVCWHMNDDAVLGSVLGVDVSVVESDVKRVKKHLAEGLARKAREGNYYIEAPDMREPEIHFHTVDVQLSYREEEGTFPLASKTPFKVAAVYGDLSDSGYGQCFLPFFKQEFYYYNLEQRTTLIKHFTREFLQHLTPESAYQYILPSQPWLEYVKVRTDAKKKRFKDKDSLPKILTDVADNLPAAKKQRRNTTRLPDVAWERSREITSLARTLTQGNANVLLIGDQGVGKSTLLNEAIRMVSRENGEEMNISFWRTSCQRLVGKAKYLGEWQAICDDVVDALAGVNGILWVSDFMSLLRAGGESQEDSMAAYLQSYVQKGQLRIIGEVKPQELELARSLLPGFVHLFKQLKVDELAEDSSRRVLAQLGHYAQINFSIQVQPDALDLCYLLSNRYLKYEKRPGNVVRFFSECIKNAVLTHTSRITREFVISQFVEFTGLPENLLRDDMPLTKKALFDFFAERIKGQDQVLEHLCNIVQVFKAGLNDPQRPIATLLFAGPTGVGKTAATKALAEYFFSAGQKKNPLFSLDMSEFQHMGQISRLIGDHNSPGKLVSHVRNHPFSVILLDEIEKAHPSVFDMLLTVLDEGILTDRHGRLTDFRSSIIIMTSNLGVQSSNTPGFAETDTSNTSLVAIRKHFRPEFFNRIDTVLSFKSLDRETITAIVERELQLLHKRDRIKQEGITLAFSQMLVEYIADVGFSKAYGARPIQRAIEKYVVAALARFIMKQPHAKKLALDYCESEIVIHQVKS